MNSVTDQLRQRISTIHNDDAEGIRREVTEILQEFIPGELALFFRAVRHNDGYLFTAPVGTGKTPFADKILALCEGVVYDTPWLPENLTPEVIDRFVRIKDYYDTSHRNFEVNRDVLYPMGVCDQMRAILYDGRRFIGWLGMMRSERYGRFSRREQQLLQSVAARFKTSLAAADNLEAEALDDSLFAVLNADGELEHASPAFVQWCDDDRSAYLKRRIRQIDAGEKQSGIEVRAGLELRAVRLDATGSVRYLVTVDRAALITLRPEYWLTDRQREIAEYAVAGATSREIAEALDISKQTVKTHIKNSYRRLGVANRAELVTMLGHLGQ